MAFNLEESGWTPADGKKEELASYVSDFLKSKSEMLEEYFAMEIDKVFTNIFFIFFMITIVHLKINIALVISAILFSIQL